MADARKRSKRHHAVPEFYLRRFAVNGLVWLHKLEKGEAVPAPPQDVTAVTYLYAPEVGDDPKDDSLEQFFANEVDGPATEPLAALARGDTLTPDAMARVALYVAFQERRVTLHRDFSIQLAEALGQQVLDMAAANVEAVNRRAAAEGSPMSDGAVTLLASGTLQLKATKVPWLDTMVTTAEPMAQAILQRPWTVVEAPPTIAFVTSDAPVVKVLAGGAAERMGRGIGWLVPGVEGTFPLDPQTCLIIGSSLPEGRMKAPRALCKEVNRRTVMHAHRFVMSRDRDAYIERMAAKRDGPAIRLTIEG